MDIKVLLLKNLEIVVPSSKIIIPTKNEISFNSTVSTKNYMSSNFTSKLSRKHQKSEQNLLSMRINNQFWGPKKISGSTSHKDLTEKMEFK